MANFTSNYNLTKPLESEFYDIAVFNDNFDKIDTAVKAAADAAASAGTDKADLVNGVVPESQLPEMNYDEKGKADSAVSTHNASETAHPYLRNWIKEVETTANAAYDDITKLTKTISIAPSQSGSLTYNGEEQSPAWSNYDSSKMTIGGTTSATAVGSYTATFTPNEGYTWGDGTQSTIEVTWSINNAVISTVPSQSGTLTYTGSAQSPTWSNYDSSKMTIGGTTSATNAGSYTATFTPAANYEWSDGSTSAKSVTWSIAKATGSLTLSETSVEMDVSTTTATVTVTRSGDGTITATSSSTSVATASVSGTTITITGVAAGSATITVSVAAGTNYTAPASQTISVTVTMPSTTLNSNEWSIISAASDAGIASSYWSVGDRKAVALSGTVGALSLSGTYYCYILGFDHNSSVEGSNRIHFQFGYTALSGGTHVAFVDSTYNSSSTSACFHMNSSNTNSGGWSSSYMRGTICPAFKSAMPTALQNVLKTVTKYTDNTGGGSNSSSYVTATADTVFICAEYEIFGTRSYTNSYEQNYQKQYAYYSAGNSKVMYRHSSTSSTCWWWERSPYYNASNGFCDVGTGGTANHYDAYYSAGFAPCFTV